jgi:hypothetical protein
MELTQRSTRINLVAGHGNNFVGKDSDYESNCEVTGSDEF